MALDIFIELAKRIGFWKGSIRAGFRICAAVRDGAVASVRYARKILPERECACETAMEERIRELQAAQSARIEQLSRSAEFGNLASGLFHDLVNYLNAALLHLQETAASGAGSVPGAQEPHETAGILAKRANDFIEAVRRQLFETGSEEIFSMKADVEKVFQLLFYIARRRDVQLSLAGDDALCFGNRLKFHQVMLNLVWNAIESYDELPGRRAGERIVAVCVERRGAGAAISVEDRGAGIPEAMREKVFTPFFTTKPDGKGAGIGLAIVKRTIETDFHGTLSLRSTVGEGSVFTVAIPPERIPFRTPR